MQDSEAIPGAESSSGGQSRRSRSPLCKWLIRCIVAAVIIALTWCAWTIYRGISVSLQAEHTIHATIMTIRVVEQFVTEQQRWPSSWEELERQSLPEASQGGMYRWPESSSEIQGRVIIDFNADLTAMIDQDPMLFTAIRPIGPYFEYRHYGFVSDLKDAVRRSIKPRE